MNLLATLKGTTKSAIKFYTLPPAARDAHRQDHLGLGAADPGIDAVVEACTRWLYRAQDCSSSHDGGIANHFSLVDGWGESYPETSGYIVPTFLEGSRSPGDEAEQRAKRVLDWFVTIQFPEGGFQGSTINALPRVPVTFNTGQILLGLAAGTGRFGATYGDAMHKAAAWLRDTMDSDGAWRRHPTPFAAAGEKAYETHVAWGLLEAERVARGHGYAQAALKNMKWAVTKQQSNGWFADCCLGQPLTPLTHTIGYVVRGLIEGWRFSGDKELLDACLLTSEALLPRISPDGHLAGRFDRNWNPAVEWACMTGSSQIAHNLLLLYGHNGDQRYLDGALALNRFVRRSVRVAGNPDTVGGVRGSFPIDGSYGGYRYLNWAAKFTIDSQRMEKAVLGR